MRKKYDHHFKARVAFENVCEMWEGKQPDCFSSADQSHGAHENGGEAK